MQLLLLIIDYLIDRICKFKCALHLRIVNRVKKSDLMVEIIECNPEILGGKPVIKGTRIPISLIFELISLDYSIGEIIEEYPNLNKEQILTVIKIGKDFQENLQDLNLKRYLEKELVQS